MSFIKLNKGKPKHPPRKRKVTKPKPWDDTISDLDAYKATPDEIAYRREAHRSKHAVTTHLLKGMLKQGKRSPLKTNSQARKYAIMKEVLYDQQQLQDVLEKSDTMMAVVKDLFGDDPRRFAGFPTVTSAPHAGDNIERSLIRLPGDIKTRSEVLSDSVMDGSALNEFQDSDSEEDTSAVPLVYQPKLNMQRFQQFIEAEEKNNTLSTISGQAGLSHLGPNMSRQPLQGNAQSSQLPEQSGMLSQEGSFQTPKGNKNQHDESLEILRPPGSAINDTSKVNKTKRRVPRPEPPEHNTSSNFSLNDLRKVLEILEDEIAEYERVTGRRPPAERQRQETFSGYTLAIVDSVTKLTRYLKESELRLQAEMTVREQLTQDVVQFRALVDALTSDIIFTQEEFGKMAAEFQKFKTSTEHEIIKLKGEQIPVTNAIEQNVVKEPVTYTTPPKSQKVPSDVQNNEQIPAQMPGQVAFREHLQPVSSAVMLSPPVRRNRVSEMEKDVANKQGSLIDFPEYLSGAESNNSAVQDEFTDLPGLCPTSNAPIPNQVYAASMADRPGQSVLVSNSAPQHMGQQIPQKSQTSVPVNSVSVPRPTPLVQSNVGIPFSTEQGQIIQTNSQNMPASFLQKNQPISISARRDQGCQQFVVDDQGQLSHRSQDSTDREHLASQIAALNRQHAEAQKRLQGLMLQKEMAAQIQQQQQQQQQQQVAQQQQQQQYVAQQVQPDQVESQNQPRDQPGTQTQVPAGPQKQQLQYMQQQRLIALVQHQQQRLQQQQQQQQQQQMQGQASQHAEQAISQRPKPNIPEQYSMNGDHGEAVHDIPGHRVPPKQVGLPDYPVSPNISPISRRSENMANVYRSVDSQDTSVTVPASRGIMISLPKVDMDMSAGSPGP